MKEPNARQTLITKQNRRCWPGAERDCAPPGCLIFSLAALRRAKKIPPWAAWGWYISIKLCLTERRVRQLRDEGVIVEARPGLYELQPTVARYIKYLGGAGKESLNTERMKLTAEKRKAAEMDNDLRRGDLHSTQDIEKGIQTMCLNIRSRFLAMPAKLSPTLAAMDGNQAAIFDEMKKAIDETLEELSDYRVAFAVEDTADERTEEK